MQNTPLLQSLRFYIKNVLLFTPGERRALVMLSIISFCTCSTIFYFHVWPTATMPLSPHIIAQANKLIWIPEPQSLLASPTNDQQYINSTVYHNKTTPQITPFNPNLINEEQWIQLGLSPKQAAVITNFKKNNGLFRNKNDVKKIYVINSYIYNRIEPYLIFDNYATYPNRPILHDSGNNITNTYHHTPTSYTTIDINLASPLELEQLPAIGPSIAKGIVAYRERLHGYHSINQLQEVYNLHDSVLQLNKERFTCNPHHIRPININTATIEELRHPYIEKFLAKIIVAYRTQHGPFSAKKDLLLIQAISKQQYNKMEPYITTE